MAAEPAPDMEDTEQVLVAYPGLTLALGHLLARCDGAQTRDDAGFNKPDSGVARRLARTAGNWTDDEARQAGQMLHTYRRQLTSAGLYDAVPTEEEFLKTALMPPGGVVSLGASVLPVRWDHTQASLVIDLDYHDGETRERLKTVPGRRWEGDAKVWRIVPGADTADRITEALAGSRLIVPESVVHRLQAVVEAGAHGWVEPLPNGGLVVTVEEPWRDHLAGVDPQARERSRVPTVIVPPDRVVLIKAGLQAAGIVTLDGQTLEPLASNGLAPLDAPPPQPEAGVTLAADGWFEVRHPYSPEFTKAIREVPGRTWDGEAKVWRIPAQAASWTRLAHVGEEFGLVVREAAQVRGTELAQDAQVLGMASTTAIGVEIDIPGLNVELRPFQSSGVAYALKARQTLLADEMGLGKTIQALATAAGLQRQRTLVLCPPALRLNWAREVAHCLPDWTAVVVDTIKPAAIPEALAQAELHGNRPTVLIAGYSLLRQRSELTNTHLAALEAWVPDALVCDESHQLKGRAKDVRQVQSVIKLAATIRVRESEAPILLLSGTPMLNAPKDLISQLQILGRLEEFGGWYGFASAYCGLHQQAVGKGKIVPIYDGCTRPRQLNEQLRSSCMVRRLKTEVEQELGDLLEKNPPRIELDLEPKAMREYRTLESDFRSYLARRAHEIAAELGLSPAAPEVMSRLRGMEQAGALEKFTALRKVLADAKVPEKAEIAKELGAIPWLADHLEATQPGAMSQLDGTPLRANEGKTIVFAHHQKVVKRIAGHFGAPMIYGGEPDQAVRQRAIDQFQNDPETRLIVCSLGAGSEGITLTRAAHVVFLELPWRPTDIDQAVARAWRIGQTQRVTPYYLLGPDTIDDDMAELLAGKAAVFHSVIEGGPRAPQGSVEGELLARIAARAIREQPHEISARDIPVTKTERDCRPMASPTQRMQIPSRAEIAGAVAIPQLLPLESATPAKAALPAAPATPATGQSTTPLPRSYRGQRTRFDR